MTKNENLKKIILDLAEPVVKSLHLEIWGMEITGGQRTRVCIFVDKPFKNLHNDTAVIASENSQESVNIDQCEEISRAVGLALDVEDCIQGPWNLEISSPGMNRKFFQLEQMSPYIGQVVDVKLREALPQEQADPERKFYRGILSAVGSDFLELQPCAISDDGQTTLEGDAEIRIPWQAVFRAELVPIFPIPAKPGKGSKNKGSQKKNSTQQS